MTRAQRTPDIRTKRVYDPPDGNDGSRVLVDRLWPRGLTKEKAALTLWLKEIAPSSALRTCFDHDPGRWDEFGHRYRAELTSNGATVARLMEMAKQGRLTLLYAARDVDHNQALVLAAYLHEQLHASR